MEQSRPGLILRWRDSRPTKTLVFWACLGSAVATMIVGFTWGGWVTGTTARGMAEASGESAVARRLGPMCIVRFEQDPMRVQKLKELKGTENWQRGDYVKKQGWATMPGEKEPDSKVAGECAKLLLLIS